MVSGNGYLLVPGRPINFDNGRTGNTVLAVGAGGRLFGYFSLAPTISLFPLLSGIDGSMM